MVGHVQPVVYRIGATDIVEEVNEVWGQFAIENGAPSLATDVIGKSLWNYVSGREVRRIYQSILQQVRAEQRQMSFPFRCDSPKLYRSMRLFVAPLSGGRIEFCSVLETICSQPQPLDILAAGSAGATTASLTMCSWCKAIALGTQWRPIETALEELKLLTPAVMPTISNDVCDSCLADYLRRESPDD